MYFIIITYPYPGEFSILQHTYFPHIHFLRKAVEEAETSSGSSSRAGAVLVKEGQIVVRSRNHTEHLNNPVATAEMECIRQAGRRGDYPELTLYSTRYPDMLTAGTILQFSIGAVVIGLPEQINPAIELLKSRGMSITFVADESCIELQNNQRSDDLITASDANFLEEAYLEALEGYRQGGVPVGAVMVRGGEVIARGRNKRMQEDDPVMHGETDCLRNAGVLNHYNDIDLYTTLSPCMMCTGAIIEFGIRRVIVGEDQNFPGNIEFLRENNVEVVLVDDEQCKTLMSKFIRERPDLWYEDIAGNEEV